MGSYFCTECGYESYEENERICPHCNIPMEELYVKDDAAGEDKETYPTDVLNKAQSDEDIDLEPVTAAGADDKYDKEAPEDSDFEDKIES